MIDNKLLHGVLQNYMILRTEGGNFCFLKSKNRYGGSAD
jgi:hypothetical protein